MNLSSKGNCMIHIRQYMQRTLQIQAAESCCKIVVTLVALYVLRILVVAGAVVREVARRARREVEVHATQARLRDLQAGVILTISDFVHHHHQPLPLPLPPRLPLPLPPVPQLL